MNWLWSEAKLGVVDTVVCFGPDEVYLQFHVLSFLVGKIVVRIDVKIKVI